MPLYQYKCMNCKNIFGIRKKYTERIPKNPMCPRCSNYNTSRIIEKINVIYKGEGFYTTDKEKENSEEDSKK